MSKAGRNLPTQAIPVARSSPQSLMMQRVQSPQPFANYRQAGPAQPMQCNNHQSYYPNYPQNRVVSSQPMTTLNPMAPTWTLSTQTGNIPASQQFPNYPNNGMQVFQQSANYMNGDMQNYQDPKSWYNIASNCPDDNSCYEKLPDNEFQ